jgi:hypothetical protein
MQMNQPRKRTSVARINGFHLSAQLNKLGLHCLVDCEVFLVALGCAAKPRELQLRSHKDFSI